MKVLLSEVDYLNLDWNQFVFDVFIRCRRSELQTRQLGDLEFTNRQAELLKSKAKLSSLCSFLRRMQNSMKRYLQVSAHLSIHITILLFLYFNIIHTVCFYSGLTGDTERVNTLMKQHMCASVYQWHTQPDHLWHNNMTDIYDCTWQLVVYWSKIICFSKVLTWFHFLCIRVNCTHTHILHTAFALRKHCD